MFILNIDTGGTFTDCLAITPYGERIRRKVLSNATLRGIILELRNPTEILVSSNWGLDRDLLAGYTLRLPDIGQSEISVKAFSPSNRTLYLEKPLPDLRGAEKVLFELTAHEEAPVLCARLITGTALHEEFPEMELRLGSTKGTNALLEYKGAPSAMLLTKGFRDLLKIGNQQRPNIFARNVHKSPGLSELILEVNERVNAAGEVLEAINPEEIRHAAGLIKAQGITSVGVALMHSWINPEHENIIGKILEEEGLLYLSLSSELSPMIKYLSRAQTAEVNAYLSPIIHDYIGQISRKVGGSRFRVMNSAGGMVRAGAFHPKDSLLSGPAGGVIGAGKSGRIAGYERIISFDMGGTSTDVSRFDGAPDYCFELEVGRARINSAALHIETVAAGGGSICTYDGFKLSVGPESAGAMPGPSCYGAGGPLTITDVNLLAGNLDPARFNIPVYPEAAEQRLAEILESIERQSGQKTDRVGLLNGFLRIANETMAGAIRKISTARGYDPGDYAMVAFGGAGGMHACGIAELLQIRTVIIPENAGILSAYGIGEAYIERIAERQVLELLEERRDLDNDFFALEESAMDALTEEGLARSRIGIRSRKLFLRLLGQETSLEVEWQSMKQVLNEFRASYESMYGHWNPDRPIEVESMRVVASEKETTPRTRTPRDGDNISKNDYNTSDGHPIYERDQLKKGEIIRGPSLILDPYSSTFLEVGWTCKKDAHETLLLHYEGNGEAAAGRTAEQQMSREAELELYSRRFMGIAENMGAMLQHASVSVNVKERLDFSCAILDADGYLVANAPHIPVHLGSLGICVRRILEEFELLEGETIVTNHPAYGGSHLPDITLVSPVYSEEGMRIGFVVNRAHHAEIGGISPGSMPPDARSLAEEGVVIKPFYLAKRGEVDWLGMEKILTEAPYPTRNLAENLADLNGALAANVRGVGELRALATVHGAERVKEFMGKLKDYARQLTLQSIAAHPLNTASAVEMLDDGSRLEVCLQKASSGYHIDFTGSAPVHPGNLNANPAIVHSVIMYVLRLLLDREIPLNDGLLEAVEIKLPEGLLNPPFPDDPFKCPALVGGNVEISQRLTDTLLKALQMQAASQGTMNNVIFGNDSFGYYETICGGCGAGPAFHGADAVHHHMTNTRITDPEIMEHRYPVRLERFEIRTDSGGKGKFRGGEGIIREIRFLEPVELSLLTQRRNSGPYGMKGGEDGQPGRQILIRKNGDQESLAPICTARMNPGDRLLIETPGGGGYGRSNISLPAKRKAPVP